MAWRDLAIAAERLRLSPNWSANDSRDTYHHHRSPRFMWPLVDKEQAMAWLEKAYQVRDSWIPAITVEPPFKPLHSDPHFRDLVRWVGLQSGDETLILRIIETPANCSTLLTTLSVIWCLRTGTMPDRAIRLFRSPRTFCQSQRGCSSRTGITPKVIQGLLTHASYGITMNVYD